MNLLAGALRRNNAEYTMKVKTTVKAGGVHLNHNAAQARAARKAKGLKVKTNVKAGVSMDPLPRTGGWR